MERTDAFVRLGGAGSELEHVGSLLPQTPTVQDFPVTLLKVIKLQHVGGIQQSAGGQEVTSERHQRLTDCHICLQLSLTTSPLVHVVLLSLSLPWICVTLVAIAIVVRRRFTPGAGVLRVSTCKQEQSI